MSVYQFMQANRAEFHVTDMARVLGVFRSGFYRWLSDAEKRLRREAEDSRLIKRMRTIQEEVRWTYGARRMRIELFHRGDIVGFRRVIRLMRKGGLRCRTRRAKRGLTKPEDAAVKAPDMVGRKFTAERPNQLWVADSTHIHTLEGAVYLAIVLDVHSRRVVGYRIGMAHTAQLMVEALQHAASYRTVTGTLIHHSDQGSQYTSRAFRECCRRLGIERSMGRVGNCYDNAMAEAFFSTLETELLDAHRFRTREESKIAISRFIDGFYNTRRLHSALGYMSPVAYEKKQLENFNSIS